MRRTAENGDLFPTNLHSHRIQTANAVKIIEEDFTVTSSFETELKIAGISGLKTMDELKSNLLEKVATHNNLHEEVDANREVLKLLKDDPENITFTGIDIPEQIKKINDTLVTVYFNLFTSNNLLPAKLRGNSANHEKPTTESK